MRCRLLCMVVVMLAGCGKSKPIDPATDRLPEGTEVRVYSVDWPKIDMMTRRSPDAAMASLPVGTRARVLDDPGVSEKNPRPLARLVRILVLEGKHEGEAGEIPRMFLRARVAQ